MKFRGALNLKPGLQTAARVLCCFLLILSAWVAFAAPGAKAESEWSTPKVVFRTDSYATRPRLVADATGDVHLFFFLRQASDTPDGSSTMIMYSRLHDGAWSSPVDVLVGAGTNAPTVVVDQRGMLHVVWEGGPKGEILYSRAHVSQAGSARGWSTPRLLSEPSAYDSDIQVSDDGTLHLVYSTKSGNVWYQESRDSGTTWSSPLIVAETETPGCTTNNPRLAVDSAGGLHAAWTELQLPTGWPPCGALYSDSLDGGKTWSSPVRIAGPGYGQINVLANGASNLMLAWNAMVAIGERKFTRSIDGGFGWAAPQYLSIKLRGGFTGIPSMATDSAGMVHLVTAVDRPRGESMAVYYLTWNGMTWSDPVLVSMGALGLRSVELPWIVVSNGNQLHVVYEDDFQRIWYTTRTVSAPQIPAQPLPTPALTGAAAREAEASPTPIPPTPLPDLSGLPAITAPPVPMRDTFLIGMAPVAAIVGLVVAGRLLQRLRE
ncbi:MAG: sialidase family protein [Chloroflexota bacterium]